MFVHDVKTETVSIDVDATIQKAQSGCTKAEFDLRQILSGGVHWLLRKHRGSTGDRTKVTEILDGAMLRVQNGEIRSSTELSRFIQNSAGPVNQPTVVRPVIEDVEIVKRTLANLLPKEREAMVRFYRGEAPETICEELGFTLSRLNQLRVLLRRATIRMPKQGAHDGPRMVVTQIGSGI
jgi:hypothetical protein